jgi:site-specific DNA-methyltransferase (adenine-specific)
MVVNIEDAGFEIRDVVSWIYGQGFPKSLNISKAIDKAAGAEREVTRSGDTKGAEYAGKFDQASSKDRERRDAPATPEAEQWDGWGTALKPSSEFFTLCRKPLSEKTIAKNVLKWGTGGINIDACRVGSPIEQQSGGWHHEHTQNDNGWKGGEQGAKQPQGRFPANLILDGSQEVLELFPETKPSKANPRNNKPSENVAMSGANLGHVSHGHSDNGGSAARFFKTINDLEFGDETDFVTKHFYCAKASKKDRNEGLEGFKAIHRINGNKWTDQDYRVASGERPPTAESGPRKNIHPTVKPTALMQYLCRLITPPNGIVLDPYMGSGSTGKAALREGFSFVGCELDADYYEIAKARVGS